MFKLSVHGHFVNFKGEEAPTTSSSMSMTSSPFMSSIWPGHWYVRQHLNSYVISWSYQVLGYIYPLSSGRVAKDLFILCKDLPWAKVALVLWCVNNNLCTHLRHYIVCDMFCNHSKNAVQSFTGGPALAAGLGCKPEKYHILLCFHKSCLGAKMASDSFTSFPQHVPHKCHIIMSSPHLGQGRKQALSPKKSRVGKDGFFNMRGRSGYSLFIPKWSLYNIYIYIYIYYRPFHLTCNVFIYIHTTWYILYIYIYLYNIYIYIYVGLQGSQIPGPRNTPLRGRSSSKATSTIRTTRTKRDSL